MLKKVPLLVFIGNRHSPEFLWVNNKVCEILEWDLDELTTIPFTKLIHPLDLDESMKAFEKFQKTGSVGFDKTFVNRYKTKSGEWVHLSWVNLMETDDDSYMMFANIV